MESSFGGNDGGHELDEIDWNDPLEMLDARPDAKPRKHARLWQAYLWWRELMLMRQRHILRISAALRGKSNFDAEFEYKMLVRMGQWAILGAEPGEQQEIVKAILTRNAMQDAKKNGNGNGNGEDRDVVLHRSWLDSMLNPQVKIERDLSVVGEMIQAGEDCGPIWGWLTGIKGLGNGSLAAQLLAQIDDVGKFETISKLWRFAGYAVINGRREYSQPGEWRTFSCLISGSSGASSTACLSPSHTPRRSLGMRIS